MATSLVGKTSSRPQKAASGVTLIELLVVVSLISLMVGISFPAITSGIDTLRLNAAANSIVNFFNTGLSRADRRQQVVEITIWKARNSLEMHSSEAGFARTLALPEGVTISAILPQIPEEQDAARTFLLYPGGVVPPFGVQILNRRSVQRIVRIDPITGVPRTETPKQ